MESNYKTGDWVYYSYEDGEGITQLQGKNTCTNKFGVYYINILPTIKINNHLIQVAIDPDWIKTKFDKDIMELLYV